jgi:hypothetical protein
MKTRLHNVGYSHTLGYAKNTLGHYEKLVPIYKDPVAQAMFTEMVSALEKGDGFLEEAKELLRARRLDESDAKLDRAIQAYEDYLSQPRKAPSEKAWIKDLEYIREGIQGQRDYARVLRVHAEVITKSTPEIMLLWASPFVLAVSLAVRLAKASAKLQLEAQKRLPLEVSP